MLKTKANQKPENCGKPTSEYEKLWNGRQVEVFHCGGRVARKEICQKCPNWEKISTKLF